MKRIFALILAALLLCMAGCTPASQPDPTQPTLPPAPDTTDDNYRVFYQIFVGSFSDSNGDGVGDLKGILNRLDYLNDGNVNSNDSLGVQGLWLSPIYDSPSYHKYDTRDYETVDPKFGTMEDLRALVDACHERNVKVILDLAINHTSTQHQWFQDFCQAHKNLDISSPYYEFYSYCTDANRKNGITYNAIPGCPGEYYECNFSQDMPELNYDNENVRQAVLDVAKQYLELGVDGFRFDAIKYIYYGETSRSVDFWKWYMEQLRLLKPDIYCVGECWSGEGEVLEYFPALNCFNFGGAQGEGPFAMAAKGGSIHNYTNYVESYLKKVAQANPEGMAISFIANHDMDRAAGYLTPSNHVAHMGANLYLLSGGSPFLYYGEEIGMKGTRGSSNTDANRRLAMLWGDEDTVRDPEGSTYDASKQTNGTVAEQMADKDSLYHHYCRLISIRARYPEIARGSYTAVSLGSDFCGGFSVSYEGSTIGIFHNVSQDQSFTVDLSQLSGTAFTTLCESVGVGQAELSGTTLTIPPQTSVIVK